jgi:phage gpG-like protein
MAQTAAELIAHLEVIPVALQAAIAAKAADLAARLQAHVTRDKLSGQSLQVRTGALRDSIQAEVDLAEDTVLARVFSSGDIKYAAIQEYGGRTAAHDIAPDKAKALAFLAGGQIVFARIVHHPGSTIPEHAYLRSSLADMADEIIGELKAAAVGTLTG